MPEVRFLPPDIFDAPEHQAALAAALKEAGVPVAETLTQPVVSVSARPSGYWNNTGIYKPKGILLVVSYAGGSWRSNPYWGPTDAGGDGRYIARSTYLRPGAPEGALIGKVGGDSNGGGSETFAIGNYGFIPQDLEGLLWLTVNDEPRGFGDNSGAISVTVNVAGT